MRNFSAIFWDSSQYRPTPLVMGFCTPYLVRNSKVGCIKEGGRKWLVMSRNQDDGRLTEHKRPIGLGLGLLLKWGIWFGVGAGARPITPEPLSESSASPIRTHSSGIVRMTFTNNESLNPSRTEITSSCRSSRVHPFVPVLSTVALPRGVADEVDSFKISLFTPLSAVYNM